MSDLVEISKAELDVLRRGYGLMDKLWNDPKRGLDIKKAAKEIDPTLKVPDLEIVSAVTEPVNAKLTEITEQNQKLNERLDKLTKDLTDKDEEGKLRTSFDKVRKEYSLTDEGVESVVGLMRDRQIADPEAAAALWARQQPKPPKPIAAPSYLPASLDITGKLGSEDDIKQWLADPMKKFDSVVADILNESAA